MAIIEKAVPVDVPNAFAVGVPGFGVVFVTRGATTQWSEAELDGVRAHERAHINRGHLLAKLVLAVVFVIWRRRVVRAPGLTRAQRRWRKLGLRALWLAIINPVSYFIERAADTDAGRHGYGAGLADALAKVAKVYDKPANRIFDILVGHAHPATWRRVLRLREGIPPGSGRADVAQSHPVRCGSSNLPPSTRVEFHLGLICRICGQAMSSYIDLDLELLEVYVHDDPTLDNDHQAEPGLSGNA